MFRLARICLAVKSFQGIGYDQVCQQQPSLDWKLPTQWPHPLHCGILCKPAQHDWVQLQIIWGALVTPLAAIISIEPPIPSIPRSLLLREQSAAILPE